MMLGEHEAAPKDVTPSYQQSPEEESVSKMVKRLFEQAKAGSKKFRGQWPTNYQFLFGGRQWPIERPRFRFSEVINTTWADVMTELGIQTDSRPKADFQPTDPSDTQFCEILKEINDYNWQRYSWLDRVAQNILDSKWVHVSHAEICWNPDLESGLGDVDYRVLNPYGCYWDPRATDISDARYFIYVEPTPTNELKADYPEHAEAIQSDVSMLGESIGATRESHDIDRVGFNLPTGTTSKRPVPDNEQYGGEQMTLKFRVWIKDESMEELVKDITTPEGKEEKQYTLKKRYPGGRYLEMASNCILIDGPNGVVIDGKLVPYKHGKFPIVRWVNYAMPREYCGENEVTHRMGPQIVTNYIASFMLDTMKQASNPKEVFSITNQDASEDSSNQPGEKLVLTDFNGYRREPGQGIPPNLESLLEQSFKWQDKVGGLQDVMRGAVDPAIGSGVLFDGYVEAAQVRPRLKQKNVDKSLQEVGQLVAALYFQFYKADRTVRLTNKQGWPEFVTFRMDETPNGGTLMTYQNHQQNGEGRYLPGPAQQVEAKGVPDIQITSGSSVPFQKVIQYNRAKDLFVAGAIDRQALLEEIDFPKKDEVNQRMQEAEQQQAQAANQPK